MQLRQNIVTAQAAAVNASNIALRENRQSIFESAGMTDIFMRGNEGPLNLGEIELLRYRLVMQNLAEALLDIYSQTAVTNFSPETWATQGVTVSERVLGSNGGRWFWDNYADNYPKSFRSEIDRILLDLSADLDDTH